MQDLEDLNRVMQRQVPIIALESHEEARTLELITRLAIKRNQSLYQWTLTDGLRRTSFGEEADGPNTRKAIDALTYIKSKAGPGLYVMCDLHPFMDDASVVRLLKDIALQHEQQPKTLLLLSHALELPPEIARLCARFKFAMPDETQLMHLVKEEARRWGEQTKQRVRTDPESLRQLISHLKGVTLSDARHLVRGAIADDGAITDTDLPLVNKAKFALMDMEAILSFEYDTADFADVAGLKAMKEWLAIRKNAFFAANPANQPKGLMLLGMQGAGKSLAAKAIAGSWKLPLLRLDMGALYNKFFGETEKNLREALQLAEHMAPCVLWMDEIEKAIGQDQNDNGVSQRLLGTLLTWMAERKSPVFMVATANNIEALPPELIRKGRFDEVFFVDLPGADARQEIFRIHLRKRGLEVTFGLANCVLMTEGFSGAEIEQAVVSAMHLASARSVPLGEALLLEEISRTRPLSVLMAEKLSALREWAMARAVAAD